MATPAEVIGRNVRAAREHRGLTAEAFAERVGEILGSTWPRQTVYLLEAGGRRLAAEEVVAIAIVLDVSIADLFTPPAEVDRLEVGQQSFPREQLLTIGERDPAIYEIARHTQALRRSFNDLSEFMQSQRVVLENIDRALLGKPALYEQPPIEPGPGLKVRFDLSRDYARAREWYARIDDALEREKREQEWVDRRLAELNQNGENE
jgi:transcriptional regulator with XRE-family HTH domain